MYLRYYRYLVLAAAVLAASSTVANAYVGPGAGLSAVGSLFGVLAALFFALAGFVWYPIKRLLRRGNRAASEATGDAALVPEAAAE